MTVTSSARPETSERILDAAARRLVTAGAAALSMQDVADEAGVSKGLIHYHFHDKDTLLARVVDWMTDGLIAREAAALSDVTAQTALDGLWRWLEEELERGHPRALIELAHYPGERILEAIQRSAAARKDAAVATVQTVFRALGLQPRLPAPLVAEVVVAFVDGLSVQRVRSPEVQPRLVFDVFWLSVLSLAE
jgi:AcrR family transcriptional regulator